MPIAAPYEPSKFYSTAFSSTCHLPNDNTLILHGLVSRLFEVTPISSSIAIVIPRTTKTIEICSNIVVGSNSGRIPTVRNEGRDLSSLLMMSIKYSKLYRREWNYITQPSNRKITYLLTIHLSLMYHSDKCTCDSQVRDVVIIYGERIRIVCRFQKSIYPGPQWYCRKQKWITRKFSGRFVPISRERIGNGIV